MREFGKHYFRHACWACSSLFVIGALTFAVWRSSRLSGPRYQGVTLVSWLMRRQHLDRSDPALELVTANAIKTIGTNALPCLLQMAFCRDSHLKEKLLSILPTRFRLSYGVLRDDEYSALAREGFNVLGPTAKPVIPSLTSLLFHSNQTTRGTAAEMLGAIGPPAEGAIPELIQMIRSTNSHSQQDAILALGGIHSRPDVVIPALIEQISADKPKVSRISALIALASFERDASRAVMSIEKLTSDPDPAVRNYATNTLLQITVPSSH